MKWTLIAILLSSLLVKCAISITESRNTQQQWLANSHNYNTQPSIQDTYALICLPHVVGVFPVGSDCKQYLNCWFGKANIETCDDGFLFNPLLKECDFYYNFHCKAATGIVTPVKNKYKVEEKVDEIFKPSCSNYNGIEEYVGDCSKFIHCANGIAYIQQCGPGTVFNANTQICDWPYNVDCSSRIKFSGNGNEKFTESKDTYKYPFDIDVRMGDDEDYTRVQPVSTKNKHNRNNPPNVPTPEIPNFPVTETVKEIKLPFSDTLSSRNYIQHDNKKHAVESSRAMSTPAVEIRENLNKNSVSTQNAMKLLEQAIESSRARYTPAVEVRESLDNNHMSTQKAMNLLDLYLNGKSLVKDMKLAPTNILTIPNQKTAKELSAKLNDKTRTQEAVIPIDKGLSNMYNSNDKSRDAPAPVKGLSNRRKPNAEVFTQDSFAPTMHATLPIKDALKMLLQPYKKKDISNDSSAINSTAEHIMQNPMLLHMKPNPKADVDLISINNGDISNYEHVNQQTPNYKPYEKLTTTIKTPTDAELVFTGEQSALIDLTTSANQNVLNEDLDEDDNKNPLCVYSFSCGEYSQTCIPYEKVCDGNPDCDNGFDEIECNHVIDYEVRLSGSNNDKRMGRVEVKMNGKWGYICPDHFGTKEADVLCKELGFQLGSNNLESYFPNAKMTQNNNTIFTMNEVYCTGNESSISKCYYKGFGGHECSSKDVLGVVCKVPVSSMKCEHNYWLCEVSEECIPYAFMCDGIRDCTGGEDENMTLCNSPIKFRLNKENEYAMEGRVELQYRGIWGTICNDDFGQTEADVACRSLGFTGSGILVNQSRQHQLSSGPIWLDQVHCIGNETNLSECMHQEFGDHNCDHTEDVAVICSNKIVDPAINEISSKLILQPVPRHSKLLRQDVAECGKIMIETQIEDEYDVPTFRVIHGHQAKKGYHPWQATIRVKGVNGKSSHWCGATIISKQHIITAAHCLTGFAAGAYFVRLGDHLSNILEESEIEIFIQDWHIHEGFRKGSNMNNDIALINLKYPIIFTEYIQPICLPPPNAEYIEGMNCTISGWGSIQHGKSTPSLELRSAVIPIISNTVCQHPNVYGNEIKNGMFCAGFLESNTNDACDGDSGGPLVCTKDDLHFLYGIISWGYRCGDANKPGVYVKMTEYLDWVKQKMNE